MSGPPSAKSAPLLDVAKTIERARAVWARGQADEAEMACRQAPAVWPGRMAASYLLGLTAYAFGDLDLAIAQVRQACQAPRAPAVYFSDFAEMCRGLGAEQSGIILLSVRSSRRRQP